MFDISYMDNDRRLLTATQHMGGGMRWAGSRNAAVSQDTRTPVSARILIHIYGEPAGVPSDPIRIQYLTIIYGNWAGGASYETSDSYFITTVVLRLFL